MCPRPCRPCPSQCDPCVRPPALSVPCTVCEFAVSESPRPRKLAGASFRGLGLSLTATHSFASLTRAPSLRSLVLLRCAQSPSFAALSPWLRHAAGFACGLFVFEAAGFACGSNTLTRTLPLLSRFELEKSQRAGVVALFLGHTDGRTGGVLWDHALRMCAWLGKPDSSRQRPAD